MSEEWDNINNNPGDNEEELAREVESDDSWENLVATSSASTSAFAGYDSYAEDIIRSEEIIRVSAENDFTCNRHGRVQSFKLFANGYGGDRPPREVNCCLHCFMDLLSHQCNATDSDRDRQDEERRITMDRMMRYNDTRIDPPLRMGGHEQ